MSLSSSINDVGAGNLPAGELPVRLQTSTPPEDEAERKAHLAEAEAVLGPLLRENEKLQGFCSHPDSVVELTVPPESEKYLFTKQYKMANSLHEPVDKILKRWIDTDKVIPAPTNCKFNNPLLAVPKKDDSGRMTGVRLCLDVRTLNKHLLQNDRFQLPHIPDMLGAFAGGQFFGEFDLSEAYFQFKLKAESRPYTAFQWQGQQYMFKGTPFGLKHIPSFFQRFISNLFRDMPFVFPYIDNLGFASATWEEHLMHAKMIIERLNSVGLRIKPSSYNLGNTQIKLLGHVITRKGIALDPEKRDMILNWPRPLDGNGLASALGLGAYLRDHIRHYADITAPLELVKRNKTIVWTDELNQSWELFKRAFASAPILRFPDFNKRFVLATDASQTGVGGVLYQPDDDEDTITADNIVAICSKQLNGSQRNYPVYKKELWGLVYCLRKFHNFLWGRRNVKVLTDHKPLIHMFSQKNMTVALQQWMDVILDYDIDIQYRPGILHVVPDALSRMYTSAYSESSVPWGTQTNVKFLNNLQDVSLFSASDFLCAPSLDEIKPLANIKKRHRTLELRDEHGKIINVKPTVHSKSRGGDSPHPKLLASQGKDIDTSVEFDVVPRICAYSVDEIMDDFDSLPDDLAEEMQHDADVGPLFAASDHHVARLARLSLGLDYEALDYDEIIEWQAEFDGTFSDSDSDAPVLRTMSATRAQRAASTLTDEEKLLLAQEKRGKTVPDANKRTALLTRAHAAGHFGNKAMLYAIERDGYWWPSIRKDIQAVINKCNDCRRFNVVTHGFHPAGSVSATLPGDHYQMDLAHLPLSYDGYKYCLVLVDVFTGFIMLKPLKDHSAEEVARAVWEIFSVIGVPKILQSDNGSEFANQVMNALTHMMGIEHRFISEYHPQADGKVERVVGAVKVTIMKLLRGATVFWPLHLPFVQYCYNDKVQALTGSTPFALMFGRRPNALKNYALEQHTSMPPDIKSWLRRQEDLLSLIYPAVGVRATNKQKQMRSHLNNVRRRLVSTQLQPGTLVMIKDPKFLLNPVLRPSSEPKYIGPYVVSRSTQFGNYELVDELGTRLDRGVPLDQIKVLSMPDKRPSSTLPTADSDEDDKVYVAESILSYKVNKLGQLEYLVKWKDYAANEATWVNAEDFVDINIVNQFFRSLQQNPSKRRAPRIRVLSSGNVALDLTKWSLLATSQSQAD